MRRRPLLAGLAGSSLLAGPWRTRAASAASATASALPRPAPLRRGSRVLALAPGTWWENGAEEAQQLRHRLASVGWELVVPEASMGRWRWFSAPDRQRLALLEEGMADPSLAAVFCVAGGWGSHRLLETGWRPPGRARWLVGFSDASALLLALLAAGQGGAVHAGLGGEESTWQRLVGVLSDQPVAPLQGRPWRPGLARGALVVTNLTVATNLIGTAWFPPLKGRLLVLEDVGEEPYRVDRMLTQWRTSGVLKGVAGIGCGRFRWNQDDVLPGDLTMEEVLRDRLGDLGVPLVGELPVGHGQPNLALPLGRLAQLDGHNGRLSLL
jgi:muramoyltetrapeptide carboxypeptidase